MIQGDQIPQPIYQQVLKVFRSLDYMRREGLADPETAIPALEQLHDQAMALKRLMSQV